MRGATWRATVAGAAIAVALVAGASAAAAVTDGMIGYSYQEDRFTFHVATINPDGTGDVVGPEGRSRPQFSPDGRREIVWAFNGLGDSSMYVRDVDGSGEIPIAPVAPGEITRASWSPDGTQIAFMLSQNGNSADSELWVADADGSHQAAITSDGMAKDSLDWGMTPSGSRIAYIGAGGGDPSDPCYGWQLRIVRPDGGGGSCVPSVAKYGQSLAYGVGSGAGEIAWSPAGTKIAMVSAYCGSDTCATPSVTPGDVWIADLAAGTVTDLMSQHGYGALHALGVAWAPAGGRLAMAADVPEPDPATGGVRFTGMGVYLMPQTGGPATRVTPPPASDAIVIADVDWQPCVGGVTPVCRSVAPAAGPGGAGAAAGGGGGSRTGSAAAVAVTVGAPVVHRYAVTMPLRCPARASSPCRGSLRLTAARPGSRRRQGVGRTTFRIRAGARRTIAVALNRRGRALVESAGVLRARVIVVQAGRRVSRRVTFHRVGGVGRRVVTRRAA